MKSTRTKNGGWSENSLEMSRTYTIEPCSKGELSIVPQRHAIYLNMSDREIRPLTEEEFNQIINDADENETWFIRQIESPYKFLIDNCIESCGMVNKGTPSYFAYLLLEDGKPILWTVVNKNVKEQFSMYKFSKRIVHEWLSKHGEIYATMRTANNKNIEWTKHLGFRIIHQDNDFISFKLGGI